MERTTKNIPSTNDYVIGQLENMKINISLNLDKIKEVEDLLDRSTKGAIQTVGKTSSFFMREIKTHRKRYEEAQQKVSKKIDQIDDKIQLNLFSITEESELNQKLSSDHPGLLDLMDKIVTIVSLFNNLFETREFNALVMKIKELTEQGKLTQVDDENNIINALMGEESLERMKKKRLLQKKKKRNEPNGDLNGEHGSGKKSKDSESPDRKKHSDEECVDIMKNAFPDCKLISKTFLTRKLTKKVTWSSEYDFNDENLDKNQKEIVKSGTYKFIKVILSVEDEDTFDIESKLVKILTQQLKNYMVKLDTSANHIVLGGELDKIELEEYLKILKDLELKQKHSLIFSKVEIYVFFEELFVEFDSDDSNTFKNLNDDEIEKIKNDWDTIQKLRLMWKDLKGFTK